MDEDPEALVERRLLRHPQHARELVAQRARAVGLDVRRRQREPVAAARQERLERRLGARRARRRAGAVVALGVEQQLVERRRLRAPRAAAARATPPRRSLTGPSASATDWPGRALDQRRELDELEVARDRVRDVEVGVQAQLAEALADPRDVREQLVAQRLERRVQRLLGPEELLLELLPLARRARRAPPRRTATAAAATPLADARRVGEHEARARRASSRRAAAAASPRRARRGRRARASPCSSASGIGSPARSRAPGIRADVSPSTKTQSSSRPAAASSAMTCTAPGRGGRRAVLVAQLGVGDGGGVAREVARRRVRRAARVGARELAEPGEVARAARRRRPAR